MTGKYLVCYHDGGGQLPCGKPTGSLSNVPSRATIDAPDAVWQLLHIMPAMTAMKYVAVCYTEATYAATEVGVMYAANKF